MTPALRYVVLWHSGITSPHFDVMIETFPGSELATWRTAQWPIQQTISMTRLKDHRRVYLEFEGELSQRRGIVERIDHGNCQLEIEENAIWILSIINKNLRIQFRQLDGSNWQASPL